MLGVKTTEFFLEEFTGSQRRKMAAVTSRGNQQWCYADVHFPLAT